MSWKYLLFDLDGTLTDSSEGILNCVIYALEAAGIEVPDREKLLQFVGPPLIEGFQDIIGTDGNRRRTIGDLSEWIENIRKCAMPVQGSGIVSLHAIV